MDNYCICLQTFIPVRQEPSESSEMVSQLLFGEVYKCIDNNEKWVLIKNNADNYEGWIDKKLVRSIPENELNKLENAKKHVVDSCLTFITNEANNSRIPVVGGSIIYCTQNNKMEMCNQTFRFESNDLCQNKSIDEIAKQYQNAPYLWGGKGYLGIDCSGLMQVIFKTKNVDLPRDASEQVKIGDNVSFIHEVKPGDLAFFDNDEGQIIHVGMFIDSQTIVHASGWVRIDPIDHQGIYKSEDKTYSHKLRVIKRILS